MLKIVYTIYSKANEQEFKMDKEKFIGLKEEVFNPLDRASFYRPEMLEQRFDKDDPQKRTVHDIKSIAGSNFQNRFVKSVCVFDETGKVYLWLNKNINGECIARESN